MGETFNQQKPASLPIIVTKGSRSLYIVVAKNQRSTLVTAIGLQLDVSEGRPMSSDFATIQETLAEVGIGVWPLDLRGVPDEFRELIHRPSLSDKERDRLLAHFMLHRERPVSSQLADASAVTNDGAV